MSIVTLSGGDKVDVTDQNWEAVALDQLNRYKAKGVELTSAMQSAVVQAIKQAAGKTDTFFYTSTPQGAIADKPAGSTPLKEWIATLPGAGAISDFFVNTGNRPVIQQASANIKTTWGNIKDTASKAGSGIGAGFGELNTTLKVVAVSAAVIAAAYVVHTIRKV